MNRPDQYEFTPALGFFKRNVCRATLASLVLGAATGGLAQVTSINSAVITPRVFNDVPTAVFYPPTQSTYPNAILLGESGVSAPTGFANRDVWQFSNNGTTPYQFQNNDYFYASFTLSLLGFPTTPRKEAGFLFSTASQGDIQFIVDSDAHEVVQFGGISFYSFNANNGITYNSGEAITLGMRYFLDGNGDNALQFFANGVASPVVDFAAGAGIGNGSTLGGYLQVQNDPANPSNGGQALFQAVTIPEPASVTLLGLGLGALLLRRRV